MWFTMSSQKIEPLLQLSIAIPENEREKSRVLSAGFTPETNTWDIIFKYHGNLFPCESSQLLPLYQFGLWSIMPLIAGYAIVTLPENEISAFAALSEIEYIEIPKELYMQRKKEPSLS